MSSSTSLTKLTISFASETDISKWSLNTLTGFLVVSTTSSNILALSSGIFALCSISLIILLSSLSISNGSFISS